MINFMKKKKNQARAKLKIIKYIIYISSIKNFTSYVNDLRSFKAN